MKLYTPADEPTRSQVLTQALAYLTLWQAPLTEVLEPVGEQAALANVITALALALVDADPTDATADQLALAESVLEQEQEQEKPSYHEWLKAEGYIPATDTDQENPADGLFHTLDLVKAHASMADVDAIFPVEAPTHD